MKLTASKDVKYDIILFIIILFFVCSNLIWWKLNHAPPMWDQSDYLYCSEILFHTLKDKGILPFLSSCINILGYKAPLITILPIPFYFLLGDSYFSALCVNLLFIFICSIYLYKLTSIIYNKSSALLSVFILNSFPLVFSMSRDFWTEYGLMTFVIAWIYYLVKFDTHKSRKEACALGIVLGFGILMKVSFPLYVVPPTLLIILIRSFEQKKIPGEWKGHLVILIVLMATIIAGPWYFKNLTKVLYYLRMVTISDQAKNYGMGDVFSLKTVLTYWIHLINRGISFYYFILLTFTCLTFCFASKKNTALESLDNKYLYLLLIWFAIPFIFFTFSIEKDVRFTVPFYPALAILMGISLSRLLLKKYCKYLPVLFMIFPVLNFMYVSFYQEPHDYKLGPFVLLSYTHHPQREEWPNLELINIIKADSASVENEVLITMLCDHYYMNRWTSQYFAATSNLNLKFETVYYDRSRALDDIINDLKHTTDYVIEKSDKLGPDFSNTRNKIVKAILDQGSLPFVQIAILPLPDQTQLIIYKNAKNLPFS